MAVAQKIQLSAILSSVYLIKQICYFILLSCLVVSPFGVAPQSGIWGGLWVGGPCIPWPVTALILI